MGKIVSRVLQVRLDYQARLGRKVTLRRVSEATGITYPNLSRLELGKTERIEFETLEKLCDYYGVAVGDLLHYDTTAGVEHSVDP